MSFVSHDGFVAIVMDNCQPGASWTMVLPSSMLFALDQLGICRYGLEPRGPVMYGSKLVVAGLFPSGDVLADIVV